MASGGENPGMNLNNPKFVRLRDVMRGDPEGGWEKCWDEEVTPWDLGQPTPVIPYLVQTGSFPKGRVLVPGCGMGYDVVALASADRYVLSLDLSNTCIKRAKERSACSPNVDYFNFLSEDFFSWHPTELFDVIFDYTFFCAIDPCSRSAWAKKVNDILKPDGELITLILLISDQVEGPPHNTSVADYEEVLNPLGFKALSIIDNELAIQPRKYAERQGINVLAETDVPGHAYSWGVGYPSLWPSADCQQPLDVSSDFMFEVIDGILSDFSKIFKFRFVHLGGDEIFDFTVPVITTSCSERTCILLLLIEDCWNAEPHVKQWLKKHRMSESDVYEYFVLRAQKIASSHGYEVINWVETFNNFGNKLNLKTVVHNC